jgi:hypothetical protein
VTCAGGPPAKFGGEAGDVLKALEKLPDLWLVALDAGGRRLYETR